MTEAYVTIIAVIVFIISFMAYKFYKISLNKDLHTHICWCVTDDSHLYRCNMSLLDWICKVPHYSKTKSSNCFFPNADKMFLIDEKYRLSGEDEMNIAREILREYQKDLCQKYFSGRSLFVKKITDEEYFLFTLKDFLEQHECGKYFNDRQMYVIKEYKDYGSWGGPLYNATYELTNFAVVYHKMYYIAQMYCLTLCKNPSATDTVGFLAAQATKEVLDKREIKISRF